MIDGLDLTSVRGFCGRGGRGPEPKASQLFYRYLQKFKKYQARTISSHPSFLHAHFSPQLHNHLKIEPQFLVKIC